MKDITRVIERETIVRERITEYGSAGDGACSSVVEIAAALRALVRHGPRRAPRRIIEASPLLLADQRSGR